MATTEVGHKTFYMPDGDLALRVRKEAETEGATVGDKITQIVQYYFDRRGDALGPVEVVRREVEIMPTTGAVIHALIGMDPTTRADFLMWLRHPFTESVISALA